MEIDIEQVIEKVESTFSYFYSVLIPAWEKGEEPRRGERLDRDEWEPIRLEVLKRDEYRCCNCHKKKPLDVHHIIPVSAGGSNYTSNLASLCRPCHKKLHQWMAEHA